MSVEEELKYAVLEICTRAYSECRVQPLPFQSTTQDARALVRDLLERQGNTSPEYRQLVQAERFDLTIESLVLQPRFRTLFSDAERIEARARLIDSIAAVLSSTAQGHAIGELQKTRSARHNLNVVPALFNGRTIKRNEGYAFHVGGAYELQFNIALVGFRREPWFRYGVAFTLHPARTGSDSRNLRPKIERFNEFLRTHPSRFGHLTLQHHRHGEVTNYDAGPLPTHFSRPPAFIFMGIHIPFHELTISEVLAEFDALIPLYDYIETGEMPAAGADPERDWIPGNRARSHRMSKVRAATIVDRTIRHGILQSALFDHLESLHGTDQTSGRLISGNGKPVDVTVRDDDKCTFYRISTALTAQACIREALGTLMGDAFWPGSHRPDRLVIVGEAELDSAARAYLAFLQEEFGLPLHYRRFDIEQGTLS